MGNFGFQDLFETEEKVGKGFSKAQILQLSVKQIEELYLMEYPENSPQEKKQREEEIEKEKQKDHPDPNDGGPRPPKEDEYPDEDDKGEDLLSEVSNPNKKD